MEVYLDNFSGTKLDGRILEVMLPYLTTSYGNPQSIYSLGSKSKKAIEEARLQVANLIGSKDKEICFVSNGTEANNLAIKGIAEAYRDKGNHIIASNIEHFSVLNSLKKLETQGYEVTYIPVDKDGLVNPSDVKKALKSKTILVSIQHANPEIGTIQDIKEISKIVHKEGIFLHTDAVCSLGLIDVDVNNLGVDLLSMSSSQIYGPLGAGALYIRKGTKIVSQINGGIQENNLRAGTENIASIVGFGEACKFAKQEIIENYNKTLSLSDKLLNELPKKIEYIYLNGHSKKRLPNNLNFSIEFVEGESMLLFLDSKNIYISSGSACASKSLKMSHVIKALNVDPALGQGSIVIGFSKYSTEQDVNYFLEEFPPIVEKLRNMSPLYDYFLKNGKRMAAGPGTDYEHEHEN